MTEERSHTCKEQLMNHSIVEKFDLKKTQTNDCQVNVL